MPLALWWFTWLSNTLKLLIKSFLKKEIFDKTKYCLNVVIGSVL